MKIKNWKKFQHFSNRRPPWIKLYRELLDDVEWHELPGDAAKVLVELWLIASEGVDGELPPLKTLCFRLRMTEKSLKASISSLSHWVEQADIGAISARYQNDPSETEREGEIEREAEEEKTLRPRRARPPSPLASSKPKPPHVEFVEGFATLYEKTGQPFSMQKKHFVIAAKLISDHGVEAVRGKTLELAVLCRDGTAWFTKNGWSDFQIETLSTHWNRIVPERLRTVDKDADFRAELAKVREQRERTDRELESYRRGGREGGIGAGVRVSGSLNNAGSSRDDRKRVGEIGLASPGGESRSAEIGGDGQSPEPETGDDFGGVP